MSSDLYLAAIPEPVTILGLRLRPLSLGHIILLNRVDSVFVTGGQQTFEDLAISVFICSQTYEEAINAFNEPELPVFMRKWHDRLCGMDRLLVKLGFRKPELIDWRAKFDAFEAYLKAHSQVPYYTAPSSGDFREMHCPDEQAVKVRLMRDMKFSESEILNRSWALCLWDYVTLRAIAGEVQMVNKSAIHSALEVANRLQEQINKRGGLNGHP